MRIGVVAPANRLLPETAESAIALARARFGDRAEIVFHPQCFLSSGHFAGDDDARAAAFLAFANDPTFDVLWMARGGYGSGRIAERVIAGLTGAAKSKSYLGYSDCGFLLAGLYRAGYRVAHAPVPADILRKGGDEAVARTLSYLLDGARDAIDPSVDGKTKTAAFNVIVLNNIVGTPLEPDLAGHVLMLEEVSEYLYALDRALQHLTLNPNIRRVAGIRLGRVSKVPDNDPPFEQTPEQIAQHWCAQSGIAYLGRADIGHDAGNKVVPFGLI
ncbi:MAG TPA: LD-carboxypeptidase [Rhizomicrobium sp.]|nr:LD-carboxypeptidase [Rhizomicrobium sp.]